MADHNEPKPTGADEGEPEAASGDAVEEALTSKDVPFFSGGKQGQGSAKGGFAEAEEAAQLPVKQEGWP